MQAVQAFAANGGHVLGICNGFQILLEAGMLPGVMLRNSSLKFVCKFIQLKVENAATRFTSECEVGDVLRIPIAHGDGNYFASREIVESLQENGQIVFRYCSEAGDIDDESNPNGSLSNIAGIINKEGNVLGMMPHPERAAETILGSDDGDGSWISRIDFDWSRGPGAVWIEEDSRNCSGVGEGHERISQSDERRSRES